MMVDIFYWLYTHGYFFYWQDCAYVKSCWLYYARINSRWYQYLLCKGSIPMDACIFLWHSGYFLLKDQFLDACIFSVTQCVLYPWSTLCNGFYFCGTMDDFTDSNSILCETVAAFSCGYQYLSSDTMVVIFNWQINSYRCLYILLWHMAIFCWHHG